MTVPKCFILSCVVAIAMTNYTSAATLAIQAGRIIPISSPEIENGIILIEDQEIKAVGTDVVIPNDARIIDAKDQTIMPGLIDAQSRLFLLDSELNQGSGERRPLLPPHQLLGDFRGKEVADDLRKIQALGSQICLPSNSIKIALGLSLMRITSIQMQSWGFVARLSQYLRLNMGFPLLPQTPSSFF